MARVYDRNADFPELGVSLYLDYKLTPELAQKFPAPTPAPA